MSGRLIETFDILDISQKFGGVAPAPAVDYLVKTSLHVRAHETWSIAVVTLRLVIGDAPPPGPGSEIPPSPIAAKVGIGEFDFAQFDVPQLGGANGENWEGIVNLPQSIGLYPGESIKLKLSAGPAVGAANGAAYAYNLLLGSRLIVYGSRDNQGLIGG